MAGRPNSSARIAIASPTRYCRIDVAGSSLIELSAAILPSSLVQVKSPPPAIQKVVFAAMAPLADALGYRATYPQLSWSLPVPESVPAACDPQGPEDGNQTVLPRS